MASYDKYLAGDLVNYTVTDEEIESNFAKSETVEA